MVRIRRALISVSDKRGLGEFARALGALGVEIISTGGTAAALRSEGIDVKQVSDVTGFPEILDGRVKTLHPKIHGGLLAIAGNTRHEAQLREHGITPIDMVVVNLYPFGQTVAREGVTLNDAVEQIDIGGPSMLRSAAKNFKSKAVIVNPDCYQSVMEELRANDSALSDATCFALAREVFHHTSAYDAAIADYLERTDQQGGGFASVLHLSARKEQDLRYGENPHQRAALYGAFGSGFRKLHGKELSFNNIVDISSAAAIVAEFDEPTVAIVKHTNPCGVGSAPVLADAYVKAFATDTKSPYGGIVAVNRPLDMETAQRINEIFTEVILAPEFPAPVLEFLRKKRDRRLVQISVDLRARQDVDVRSVPGGILVQDADRVHAGEGEFRVVTKRQPTPKEFEAIRFAWRVVRHVKSNAIVYTLSDRTLGIGAGQMSRVDSAKFAAIKAADAGLPLQGSAVGSDAFFPFADGLLEAVHAGSTSVIQPGGLVRDEEVITAADDHDLAMVFTGRRHFKH